MTTCVHVALIPIGVAVELFLTLIMSSRAFRRLGGDSFTIKLPGGTGGEEENEDEEGDISLQPVFLQQQKKNKFNPFDMVRLSLNSVAQ